MRYSFRNTLCGLAVMIAAGMLAEQAAAQTVTLVEDNDTVDLAPASAISAPEEISLFDEQATDISLPATDVASAPVEEGSVATDIIPMEGSSDMLGDAEQEDISISIEGDSLSSQAPAAINFDEEMQKAAAPKATLSEAAAVKDTSSSAAKTVSNTPPVVSGKLLGAKDTGGFDENISPSISNELFQRMSDLEKQTTLLNLELKKERVQNEIAAVKAQRLKAQQEEEARKQEEERKRIEWENEQQRLMVAEQTKLKEAEAALEQLRQEKIVKAYKETMLGEIQKWIKVNAGAYAVVAQKEAEIKQLLDDYSKKFSLLQQKAVDLKGKAEAARVAHDKKVANLESQISILKTRLEAEIEASKKKVAEAKAEASKSTRRNPFATSITGGLTPLTQDKVKLSDEYAIMEITGKNDQLAAKLINIDGDIFLAKVGTTLRNGYTIDEITQTYVSAVKDNETDILYFSAGGVLEQEPVPSAVTLKDTDSEGNGKSGGSSSSSSSSRTARRNVNATQGIPSLGQGMFIR